MKLLMLPLRSVRSLAKKVKNRIIHDVRVHNAKTNREPIENNKGSKVFAKSFNLVIHLIKLTTAQGTTVVSKSEVLADVERFYID